MSPTGEATIEARVLLVDDDPAILKGLCMAFTRAASEIAVAADGAEAMALLETWVPDLMITDIVMPNREGLETIIAARARWPQLKIIAISGGGRIGPGEFLSAARLLGADAVLQKPFRPSQLLTLAAAVLADRLAAA